jgi:hypothetical protein
LQETVRYWGATAAESRQKFDQEFKARRDAGWHVLSKVTELPFGKPGLDLVVTYERGDADQPPAAPRVQEGPAPSRMARLAKYAPYLGFAACVVAIVNFVWVIVEVQSIGDALSGHQSSGHYFVANKPGYTEVSQATWNWLRFHSMSMFVTHPVGLVGGAWYKFARDWPGRISGNASPAEMSARIRQVRESGPVLAMVSTSARFGRIWLPRVHVTVHPGGIIVKPLTSEHSILADEIDRAIPRRFLRFERVEIWHARVDFISPLIISAKSDSQIVEAIQGLVRPPEDGD